MEIERLADNEHIRGDYTTRKARDGPVWCWERDEGFGPIASRGGQSVRGEKGSLIEDNGIRLKTDRRFKKKLYTRVGGEGESEEGGD